MLPDYWDPDPGLITFKDLTLLGFQSTYDVMGPFLLLDYTLSNQSLDIPSSGGLKLRLSTYRGRLQVTGAVRSRLDHHSTLTNLQGCFIAGIW